MNYLLKKSARKMGNRFEITVSFEEEEEGNKWIDAAFEFISSIESQLSTYQPTSDTSRINDAAGVEPVQVHKETFDLIARCQRLSDLTQGAFDITYGSVDKRLWNFDTQMKQLPDKITAQKMVRLINYRNIELDRANLSVMLKEKGMRIGFGGIGKGYAAEKTREWLRLQGIEAGIVNASGDLTTWGLQPNGQEWTIGIADPNQSGSIFSFLNVSDMAVATSGNYEKFVVINGKKYSHTIDPRTGLPITGIKSVTIITPNAELADALTTPIAIMGIEAGLDLIDQLHQVECIIIDDDDKIYTSKNIQWKVGPKRT
ncbi:MAG: FAD:protein FMN transferase [Bacteroidota bacterium]